MKPLLNYFVLPRERSEFEESYLDRINRIALAFFAMHVPVFTLIAWGNDTGGWLALTLTSLTLLGPIIARLTFRSRRNVSTVFGITAMLMGGLLVHFGQGPVQIEMHFYFFVLLALLAVFANPTVIVAAAITATLHHAILWMVFPSSVFNYDAPFWVVAVHAAFVVLESIAACFIARSFFDNVIGLEKIVARRTNELKSRNKDMRVLLDSVEQGFLTVDRNGTMSEQRSRYLDDLLGKAPSDLLVDWIGKHDASAADWFEMGLDEVFADMLPVEVTLDQLPKRCLAGNRTLSLRYHPVYGEQILDSIAVVITDITAEVERELLEVENREILAMIDRISADRSGFLEFFQEAEDIIEGLRSHDDCDLTVLKRQIHTLKGNASIFKLDRIAAACHAIERHIAEYGNLPVGAEWTELFGSWASTRGNLRRLVSDVNTNSINLHDAEYRALLSSIIKYQPRDELAKRVASWQLEPTECRLQRLAEQARLLAKRLGKGAIVTRVESENLRVDPRAWAPFWSAFVHLIRNAIDHGIENPENRRIKGKCETGKLTLSSYIDGDRFVVAVADDGKGINWNSVRSKAESLGHPATTHDDLVNALFMDGLSTASEVTEISGRGIGMNAVRQACLDLKGEVFVDSETDVGMTVRFKFPIRSMAQRTIAELEHHRVDEPETLVCGPPSGQQEQIGV